MTPKRYGTINGTAFGTTLSDIDAKASQISGPIGVALGSFESNTDQQDG